MVAESGMPTDVNDKVKGKLTDAEKLCEKQTINTAPKDCSELPESSASDTQSRSELLAKVTSNLESSSCDEIIASLHQEHLDIFNADDDRQELIDYCEKMLEDCKNNTSGKTEFPSAPSHQELHRDDYVDDHNDSFDSSLLHAVGDQQLKSAYYFDGSGFVAIQVIMDKKTGECQLILPMDHPHYLGVPEEVPIFETRDVAIEELTHYR